MQKITILLLSFILLFSCNSNNSTLSLKLEKNKLYKRTFVSHTEIIYNDDVQVHKQDFNSVAEINFSVVDSSASGYKLEVRFKSLELSELPYVDVKSSSNIEDTSDVLSFVLNSMSKQKFEISLDKYGRVTEITDIESFWQAALEEFPYVSEADKNLIRKDLTHAFGSAAMKEKIELLTAIYPKHEVKLGDKWKINKDVEGVLFSKSATSFEYRDSNLKFAKFATISGDAKTKGTKEFEFIQFDGKPMKCVYTGVLIYSIQVEKNSGLSVNSRFFEGQTGTVYINKKSNDNNDTILPFPIGILTEVLVND